MIELHHRQAARHAASWRCCSRRSRRSRPCSRWRCRCSPRRARQAHEGGGARAREDAPARARAAGARREGRSCAQSPKQYMQTHRRAVQPDQMARPGGGAREAGAGRLSRPGALRHLPVLPPGDADRRCSWSRCSTCSSSSKLDQPPIDQARHVPRRRLCRHAAAVPLPQEPDRRSASCRSSAPFPDALDLLLICVESGMSIEAAFRKVSAGDRLAVDRAGRGADADHRRAVLPAGPQHGLREPRQAHRPRRREVGLHGAAAGRALRHAARRRRCA